MQRQRADIGEEGLLRGSADSSTQTFDEGGVFLQSRIERFANWEDIYIIVRSVNRTRVGIERKRKTVHTAFTSPSSFIQTAKFS